MITRRATKDLNIMMLTYKFFLTNMASSFIHGLPLSPIFAHVKKHINSIKIKSGVVYA
jgi:hypothetical protein